MLFHPCFLLNYYDHIYYNHTLSVIVTNAMLLQCCCQSPVARFNGDMLFACFDVLFAIMIIYVITILSVIAANAMLL